MPSPVDENTNQEVPQVQVEDYENNSKSKQLQLPKVYLNAQNQQKTKKYEAATNPYNNLSNYSHEATTVPPYVLYGIANSEKIQNTRYNERNASTFQDPFISSLNDNWGTFFQTVDSTPAFAEGVMYRDVEALGGLPDLSGKWGGDERLKHFLNNEGPKPVYDKSQSNKKWYKNKETDAVSSSSSSFNTDNIKSKSKAGYWMSTEKREEWLPYLNRIFLFNNYVPLFFRIFSIVLSVIALAIAVRIFRLSKKKYELTNSSYTELSQQASTIMAICVQSIALVYLFYIACDEFKSKPLGIRNPLEKMRLILLDLLFIIFSSANLALSFNTLYDPRWVCQVDETSLYPYIQTICDYQRALAAFLFVILVFWVITFTISILRVIQKVSSSSPHGR